MIAASAAILVSASISAQSIGPAELQQIRSSFVKDPATTALQQKLMNSTAIIPVAYNRSNVEGIDTNFKYQVTPLKKIPDQVRSGRCWLFSSLNYIRPLAIEKYNVDDFCFSPAFNSFWDLFEKCNLALEIAIATVDDDVNSRKTAHYYRVGLRDGGEWHNFVSVARKYGVVPEGVMKETVHSNYTANMRDVINLKMKAESWNIRSLHASGATEDALRTYKVHVMEDIYRILALCLGEPPTEFTWEYTDRNGEKHSVTTTPQEFFKSLVPEEFLDSRVLIMNDPTHEYYRMYTIGDYINAYEGMTWTYLNLPADDIKPAVLASIKNNEAVYTTCDWHKDMLLPESIMELGNIDYDALFGMSFKMSKEARMWTRCSKPAHVMLITACDTDENDKPTKWQLFNSSFATKVSARPVMTDRWFDEYVFRIVLDRKYLSPKALEALKQTPEVFPLSTFEFMH